MGRADDDAFDGGEGDGWGTSTIMLGEDNGLEGDDDAGSDVGCGESFVE